MLRQVQQVQRQRLQIGERNALLLPGLPQTCTNDGAISPTTMATRLSRRHPAPAIHGRALHVSLDARLVHFPSVPLGEERSRRCGVLSDGYLSFCRSIVPISPFVFLALSACGWHAELLGQGQQVERQRLQIWEGNSPLLSGMAQRGPPG